MSSSHSPRCDQVEDSDDLDLLTVRSRITEHSGTTQNKSSAVDIPSEKDDEPDWVHQFSQSLPNEQQRREALVSQFDEDDDDSIIDLVPDDPNPMITQPSLASDQPHSQKDVSEKTHMKRPKASTVPRSQLPLVVAPKLDDALVLLQSADQGLDLSGDVGAVGRVKIQQGLLYLDIKGTIYKADTTACNTACVVNIGEDEAKVTAVLDEAVTLVSEKNLFAPTEIVVHGELEEAVNEDNTYEELENERESKSKKRKVTERTEKGKAQSKPRANMKGSRTKK